MAFQHLARGRRDVPSFLTSVCLNSGNLEVEAGGASTVPSSFLTARRQEWATIRQEAWWLPSLEVSNRPSNLLYKPLHPTTSPSFLLSSSHNKQSTQSNNFTTLPNQPNPNHHNGYHQERRQLRLRVCPAGRCHRLQGDQQAGRQGLRRFPHQPCLRRQGCRRRQARRVFPRGQGRCPQGVCQALNRSSLDDTPKYCGRISKDLAFGKGTGIASDEAMTPGDRFSLHLA